MTTFATGNFPGAAGTSLYSITEADSGQWVTINSPLANSYFLVDGTNQIYVTPTKEAEAYDTNVSPSADMTVAATAYTVSGFSGDYAAVLARIDKNASSSTPTYYEFRVTNTGSGALTLTLYALGLNFGGAGVHYVSLASGTASASLYGTLFTLSLDVTGNVLTAKINGSTVLTYTDSSALIPGTGTQKYAGVKINSPSGTSGTTKMRAFTAASGAASLTAVGTVLAEATAAGSEICWTPIAGATSYDVKRSSTSGGTYSLLGNVLSTLSPLYQDAGQYGQWYTVTAKNGSGSAPVSAAVQAPASAPSSSVSSGTVKNYSPASRHNLLISAGGAETAVAITSPAFTEKSTQANICPGPYSDFAVAVENMAGSGLATYAALTTLNGTLTVSGGRAVYGSAAANTYDYWRSPNTFLSGALATGISAENVTGRLGVGVGVDASNGVWAEYNGADQTIRVYGKQAGTVTTFLSGTANGLTNARVTLALEICMASYVVWVQIGDAWSVLITNTTSSATGSGFYDLRYNSKMATWKPMFYLGSNVAETAATATLRDIRATGFNGIGKVREAATITHNDGTPLTQNGLVLVSHDRCGFPQGTNTAYQAVTAIHAYDPETGKIVGNHLGCVHASTAANTDTGFAAGTASCSDAKIIYDAGAGGFHIWFNDWDLNPTNTWYTSLWYQFVSGTILSQDTLLANPVRVTATGINYPGTSSNLLTGAGYTIYGPDVRQIGAYWYLTATATQNPVNTASLWRTVVLRGSSPYQFDTAFFGDLTQQGEGQTFLDIGSRLYIVAGQLSNGSTYTSSLGGLYAWDFSDLATVVSAGTLNITAQAPQNANSMEPQQPAFVAYNRGGRTKLQILGHDSQYVNGIYQVTGGFHAYEADLELEGWQFPSRKSVPTPVINTTTKAPAGQFGTI